jgi:hypothetical protein
MGRVTILNKPRTGLVIVRNPMLARDDKGNPIYPARKAAPKPPPAPAPTPDAPHQP